MNDTHLGFLILDEIKGAEVLSFPHRFKMSPRNIRIEPSTYWIFMSMKSLISQRMSITAINPVPWRWKVLCWMVISYITIIEGLKLTLAPIIPRMICFRMIQKSAISTFATEYAV